MPLEMNTIDETAVRRGRGLVHLIIVWLVVQAAAVVAWRVWAGERIGVVLSLFDLMLSVAVTYGLKLGHFWAKYLTIGGSVLGLLVLFLVTGIKYSGLGHLEWILVSAAFLILVAVIFVLLMSSSVEQFFQRKQVLRGARRYELLAVMNEGQQVQVTVGRALVFLSILFLMLLTLASSVGYLGAILEEVPAYGSLIVFVAWVCCVTLWNGSVVARVLVVLSSLVLLGLVLWGSYRSWGRLENNPRLMLPSATYVFGTIAIVLMLSLVRSVGVFLEFQRAQRWTVPALEPQVVDYHPELTPTTQATQSERDPRRLTDLGP